MKKVIVILVCISFFGCKKSESEYPRYSLETIEYIPDSLKSEHREWIKETIRAASQHMTGGDYENIDETIIQAHRSGNELFSSNVIGLRKEIDEAFYNDLILKPNELNSNEAKILDSLMNYNQKTVKK